MHVFFFLIAEKFAHLILPKLEKSYPYDFKVLLLTYKALNYLAPNYLKELVVRSQHN